MAEGARAGGAAGWFGRGLAGFGGMPELVDEGFDGLLQPFDRCGREVGAAGEDGFQQAQEEPGEQVGDSAGGRGEHEQN